MKQPYLSPSTQLLFLGGQQLVCISGETDPGDLQDIVIDETLDW
jgi:hypothetical protein